MKKLDRIGDWIRYHAQMLLHINQYTRPQYESEDAREDQVGAWTSADCIRAIERYCKRYGKNQRGNKESLRDFLKISHYGQLGYDKLKLELGEDDVYQEK